MLEVVEGQVGDQVSRVPDEWLISTDDEGGGHNSAVPHAEGPPPLQSHGLQVSVNGLPPRGNIWIKKVCKSGKMFRNDSENNGI